MLKHPAGPLPRMQVLRAFEAAARRANFTRAAEELGIQQSVVSRYIAELERQIGVRLFERSNRAVNLTPAGNVFHRAVGVGMERIATGARAASSLTEDERVAVSCSHAISHLFVIPRFQSLRRALDETVYLRIVTLDYDMLGRLGDNEVDLVCSYDETAGAPEDRVKLFGEAVMPVCSPGFAATHAGVLARPVAEWGSLPFLRFAQPTQGWATWDDWFETAGHPEPPPRYTGIEEYVYLIEAAVAGQGLALGWRYFVDRYLDAGMLVSAAGGFVAFAGGCFARLTERGRRRPVARRCLEAFATLANGSAPS